MKMIEITSLEQLADYREAWNGILEKNGNTNPFIEFDWLYAWWSHLGSEDLVVITAVEEKGRTIAFFPFTYQKKWPIHIIRFAAFGQANYMDMVTKKEDLERTMSFVLDEIAARRKNVVFYLHGLLESSGSSKALEQYVKQRDYIGSIHRVVTPYINLTEMDLNEYLNKRKKQHGLDRREKRLKKLGNVRISVGEASEMKEVFRLHNRRWQERDDTSGFTKEENRSFYETLAVLQGKPLAAQIHGLYVEDEMIAFTFGFTCRGRYVDYTVGHDNDFDSYSPGRILLKELIRCSKEDYNHILDLSIGYEPFKFEWKTDVDYTRKMIFSTGGILSSTLRSYLSGKENLVEFLKRNHNFVLFKRHAFGKIKAIFRKQTSLRARLTGPQNKVKRKNKDYEIWFREMSGLPDRQGVFRELSPQELLREHSLYEYERKRVIRKLYAGYRVFLNEDRKKELFWLHEKTIRIEDTGYLEPLPKNTIFLEASDSADILSFCSFLKRQYRFKAIYRAVEKKDSDMKERLKDMDFFSIGQPRQPASLRIGKH